jgi:hypothetical protein
VRTRGSKARSLGASSPSHPQKPKRGLLVGACSVQARIDVGRCSMPRFSRAKHTGLRLQLGGEARTREAPVVAAIAASQNPVAIATRRT